MTHELRQQCQILWNQFDPICVSNWCTDFDVDSDQEYVSYVTHTVDLIMNEVDRYKLTKHVESCVYQSMAIKRTKSVDRAIDIFVSKLLELRLR